MDHQSWRLKLAGKEMWRPFAIRLTIGPHSVSEFPLREPQLFGASVSRFGIEHAVMRDQAFKPVRMAQDPVDHVAAVAGSQSALAIFIDKRISLLGIVEPVHQVDKRLAAPIFIHAIYKCLPVTSAAAWIDHDHDVTVG